MIHKTQSAESGQIIVLFALLMVAMIGILGLSIDGGALLLRQRQAQNAVDTSILAASLALCAGGSNDAIQSSAYIAAQRSGFDNDSITNTVTVNHPPTSGSSLGNDDYVEVIVWAQSPSHFIHFVYPGELEVTTRGVGYCKPETVAFANYSFISLNESNLKAFDFSGNADVEFCGGGVWSNSGAESQPNGQDAPSVSGNVGCGAVQFTSVGEWKDDDRLDGSGIPVSENASSVQADPFANLEPPTSGTCSDGDVPANAITIITGTECYQSIDCNPGDTVTIQGDPNNTSSTNILWLNDGATNMQCTLHIENVMVYVNGSFTMQAQAELSMTPDVEGEWAYMMMWVTGDSIRINGQSNSNIIGTIYAPNAAATYNGGSAATFKSQFIADTVDFAGGNDSKIIYDEDYFFKIPPIIAIAE